MTKLVFTKKHYLLDYITLRVMKRNQNFLPCITGQTGSGKTYAALCLAETLSRKMDVPFDIDHCVFSSKELMALINSNRLQKGSCIVYDEAGVGYNNREWQSVGNKMLNYLMQTFRHRNYVVIFTMPDFSFVDVAARKLYHCRFETKMIDYNQQIVYCKPFMLTVNQMFGKQYNKYFKVPADSQLFSMKVKRVAFKLPSQELIDAYEKKKKDFTDALNKEIEENLQENVKTEKLTPLQARWIFAKQLGMSNSEASKALKISYEQGRQLNITLTTRGHIPDPTITQSNNVKGEI